MQIVMLTEKKLTEIINSACKKERQGRKFVVAHICNDCVAIEVETGRPEVHDFIIFDGVNGGGQ